MHKKEVGRARNMIGDGKKPEGKRNAMETEADMSIGRERGMTWRRRQNEHRHGLLGVNAEGGARSEG